MIKIKIIYKLIIFFAILVGSVSICAALETNNHAYDININFKEGNLSLNQLSIKRDIELTPSYGNYFYSIISFDDETLNYSYFDIPLLQYYDEVDSEGSEFIYGYALILNETNVSLTIPYYENAKQIEIYDDKFDKKLTVDVSPYSKNTTRSIAEKISVLPEEKTADAAEKIVPEKETKKRINIYLMLVVVALILILAITILVKMKRKNNDFSI